MKKHLFMPALALLLGSAAHAQNPQIVAGQAAQSVSPKAGDGEKTAGEKVELKLHWLAGKSYLVKMSSVQKIAQTIDGKPLVVDQTIGLNYLYEVQDVDAQGVAKVELTFRDVIFKLVLPGEKTPFTIVYDSTKNKEVPPIASGIASLKGQKVWMKIAPDARTVEAGGFKELLEHMTKSISLPPGTQRAMMEQTLKGQFSEQSFKEMLQKGTSGTYPAHAVAIGESWTSAMALTQSLPMQLDSTYTLQERKDGLAIINLESTLAMDSKGKPVQNAESKITMQMKGKQGGTMQIRESDGWIVKLQAKLNFSGTISIATTPTGPGDIRRASNKSWPISISGTTTIESEDL